MRKRKNYVIIGEFLQKRGEKQRKSKWGMRGEKRMAAALGLAVMLGITGCAGKGASPENTQKEVSTGNGMWEETGAQADAERQDKEDGGTGDAWEEEDGMDASKTREGEWEREEPEKPVENGEEESGAQENRGQRVHASEETEYLGGKVQNPREDGMTLAQTTLTDEDGMVTLLDVKDAKKIPVKFTSDTKVEHWTIQGGGAGIDMQNAAASDLREGMGVEVEGYFDGETFVATRVIMEEYV